MMNEEDVRRVVREELAALTRGILAAWPTPEPPLSTDSPDALTVLRRKAQQELREALARLPEWIARAPG